MEGHYIEHIHIVVSGNFLDENKGKDIGIGSPAF